MRRLLYFLEGMSSKLLLSQALLFLKFLESVLSEQY